MSRRAEDQRSQRKEFAAPGGSFDRTIRILRIALPVAVGVVIAILLLAPLVDLALRLGEHTHVMLGVLLEVLGRHAVVSEPGVTRQLVIFVDDLLRRTAHLALGASAVEHTVDDIAQRVAVAVVLRPRTGFRGSHLFCYQPCV